MSLFDWFKPKRESKAARMHKAALKIGPDRAEGTEPIKVKLELEIPKFTEQLALYHKGMDTKDFIEHLLIDSLYVNHAVYKNRMDRAMDGYYGGKGSNLVN